MLSVHVILGSFEFKLVLPKLLVAAILAASPHAVLATVLAEFLN